MTNPDLGTPDRARVSVLGLGALGTVLTRALLAAGHPTTIWNRTPGRADDLLGHGAHQAGTPGEAVAAGPVVIVAVSSVDAVRAVLEPVASELAGRVVVSLTSSTPEQARDLADWAAEIGAGYLDGAAMSGTRLVGRPAALFLYSGAPGAFAAAEAMLTSLGRAVHLGTDPGLASLYDTALLGMNLGVLSGFYHALALVGTAGVNAMDFSSVATGYLPFVQGLFAEHARHVEQGRYPADEGTLEVLGAAVDHIVATSRQAGIISDVPDAVRALIERGLVANHGRDGLASLVSVIAAPAAVIR